MTSESTSSEDMPGKEILSPGIMPVDIEIELRVRVTIPPVKVTGPSTLDAVKALVWAKARRATEGMTGTMLALQVKNKMHLPGNVSVDVEDVDLGPKASATWRRMMEGYDICGK